MLNLVCLIVASYSRPNLALVWILNSAAQIDSKKKKNSAARQSVVNHLTGIYIRFCEAFKF